MLPIDNKNKRPSLVSVISVFFIMIFGLLTLIDISGNTNEFYKQGIWIIISMLAMIVLAGLNYDSLPRSNTSLYFYLFGNILLILIFVLGRVTNGAQSWFHLGGLSFQPSDMMKLCLIMILAKYFTRRHVEIRNVKHLFITGAYLAIPFLLILLQPDFGSAMVLLLIWGGMILVSGASRRHIIFLIVLGIISFLLAWNFSFKPYQKARIVNFIHPLNDIRGSGYNAYQSTIAVGSGGLLGKGIGYGTQSRLNYLPEHETDFIFAAFLEEWGFVGGVVLCLLYIILLYQLISGMSGLENNYYTLFVSGVMIWLYVHVIINMGMNLGVSPVTGIPLPFMSYGGSHLLFEGIGLGIALGMIRSGRNGDIM